MKTIVTDTSVFLKWLSQDNEENLENADKILKEVANGSTQIIVPELLKYEVGNVLLKGKQLTPEQAFIGLETAYTLPVTFVADSEQQAKETFTLAHSCGLSYYDASFMSLAKNYNATLVTDNLKHQGKDSNINVIALKDY